MKAIGNSSGRHQGFTLIEILIAVIVLAIGLLGVAGLQTVSIQQTAASDSRSVAVMHAQTMAERIRSIRGVPSASEIGVWLDEVRADLGADAEGNVVAQGSNSALITLQWVERMNRLDSTSADSEGQASQEPVVSSFSLNVRYRE